MKVILVAAVLFSVASLPLLRTDNGGALQSRALSGTIRVTAKSMSITTRELGTVGLVSDTTEQVWSLRNRHGHTIGSWMLACRWVNESSRLCTSVVRMPLGQISVTGVSATPYVGTYAVVGGTGLYDSVGGVADFTAIGRGKLVLIITLT